MLDRKDLERIAKVARKNAEARSDAPQGPVARNCPCVRCTYNLKGVPLNGKCPECATPVSKSIDPDHPDSILAPDPLTWRPKWWINLFGPPAPARPAATSIAQPAARAPHSTLHLCGRCGYDCAGIPRGRPCPECGSPRLASARPGALDAQIAVDSYQRHGVWGLCIAVGSAASAVGTASAWLAFGIDCTLGSVPWVYICFAAFGLAALGSLLVALAVFFVMLIDPPAELKRSSLFLTRALAVTAPVIWAGVNLFTVHAINSQYNALGGFGISDPDLTPLLLFIPAALFLSVYARALLNAAQSLGCAERACSVSIVGFPMGVVFVIAGLYWLLAVNWVPLTGYISMMFLAIATGILPIIFVIANIRVGLGIWWARRNALHADERFENKLRKWEAQARADKAHERTHGSSARL